MTIRLSISSFAGTARTLVAVGTVRLAAMFCAVRAAAPRSLLSSASLGGGAVGAAWEGCAGGTGPAVGLAGPAVACGAAWAATAAATESVGRTGL